MSKKLRKRIKDLLFEETWVKYGSEYMSHPIDQKDQLPNVPQELPVAPSEMMANQLAVEKPPVEDDKYVPDGVEELSRAAATLSQQVPDSQVELFYNLLKRDLETAINKNNDPDLSDDQEPTEAEEEEEAKAIELEDVTGGSTVEEEIEESRVRRIISKLLREQSDWTQFKLGSHYVEEEGEEDEEEEESSGEPKPTKKDKVKGKYIAPYYRQTGPSGVNITSDRLIQNFIKPLMDLPSNDVEDSVHYLQNQFRKIARKMGEDPRKMSADLPQTFSGLILKDVVKKATRGGKEFSSLLTITLNRWNSMSDKEKEKWFNKAVEEAASEEAAWDELVSTLEKEDPAQLKVLQDLNLK